MPEVETEDATLFVEVDGEGEPVTVLGHGLSNSRLELAALTPAVPGTKVRFDFRGHGRSSTPEAGYRFADFARDLDAVSMRYRATRAVGTSLGAGALCHILAREPDRFERLVFVLPAALDRTLPDAERWLRVAELIETKPPDEAVRAFLADTGREAAYAKAPWLRDLDRALWSELNPTGVARAIREVLSDVPVADRASLRSVRAPALVICRGGDTIHPAAVARALAETLPRAELVEFPDEMTMFRGLPEVLQRVRDLLA